MVKKMEFIREIKKIENNTVTIELPGYYKNREVEILILPFEDSGKSDFSKRCPFKSLQEISIDTRNFKFNREELHER
jgi:hypothetical protein